MKTFTLSIKKSLSLALVSLVLSSVSYATTFTAVSSGDFSNTTTWVGGVAPSVTTILDQIIIPSGITVNLDNNLVINGALAQLTVEGMLNTTTSSSLTLTLGTLSGAGTIILNAVDINPGSSFSFTGSLAANAINAATGFSSSADIIAGQSLNLTSGTLLLVTGGSLDVGANATIVVSGGLLSVGTGGSVGLSGNYNVTYSGVSSVAGVELSGTGLQNVTVNLTAGSTVTLTSDLTVAGTLSLNGGTLVLAGNDLTVNGTVANLGVGTVMSTSASDISINTSGGTIGSITFATGAAVNNLTVNVGAGSHADIDGSLTVSGTVQLNTGTLNFSNGDLTVTGTISGPGYLSANSSSNLTINTLLGAASILNFDLGGQLLNDLSITVGVSNAPSLGSDLTVNGTLTLAGASTLELNGNSLTLGAASNVAGSGSFVANSVSDLIINSTAGVSSLKITGAIGDLTINSGGTTMVTLANSITIDGTLSLETGILVLNGNDVTLNGGIAAAGAGTISATSASDITLASFSSPLGSLDFTVGAATIGNLTVSVGNSGAVSIGTDLQVNGVMLFTQGKINIMDNALLIGSSGSITGTDSASYIITETAGYLQRNITAGGSSSVSFPVGTTTHFAPASIHLNTGSSSGQVQVGVDHNVWTDGTTGTDLSIDQPVVDATWNVASGIVDLDMNLMLMWSAAMEVNSFNPNASHITHFTNASWDVTADAVAVDESGGMFSLQRTGITSLSPFAVFDNNTETAITEISNDNRFEIYPNPAAYTITIQNSTASTEPMNMDIYNSAGQLVLATQLANVTSTVSVENLVSGNYYIKFYNTQVSSSKKFIKM
ncbi:MAG: beta strand repeat-containing protein [Bacteroidia bacterium]